MGGNEVAIRGNGDTAGATGPQQLFRRYYTTRAAGATAGATGPQLGPRRKSPLRLGMIASKAAKQALESKAN